MVIAFDICGFFWRKMSLTRSSKIRIKKYLGKLYSIVWIDDNLVCAFVSFILSYNPVFINYLPTNTKHMNSWNKMMTIVISATMTFHIQVCFNLSF